MTHGVRPPNQNSESKLMPLEYAGAGNVREKRVSFSGVFSLVLVLLQAPWYFVVLMAAWGDRSLGPNPPPKAMAGYFVAAVMPTFLSLALGVFSIWTAGIRQNLYGVAGLAVIALEFAAIIFVRPWR